MIERMVRKGKEGHPSFRGISLLFSEESVESLFSALIVCYGLDCVLSKRHFKVLTSGTCDCDLIWK